MTALPKPKYTLEEYFELEQTSDGWFEYFDGEVFEMSGVHPRHGQIEMNLASVFNPHALSRGCRVFPSNVRLKVPTLPPYRYPDLSALCGEPKFETINGLPCLLNPSLIVEILSPSTESFDKDEEFKGYKSIETFCEYILISQNSKDITHYLKQSERFWLRGDYTEGETFRNCLENQNLRRRRMKKVARRETSGSGQVSFRALKERKTFFPRLQRGKSIANCSRRFTSGYFLIAASRLKTIFKQFLRIETLDCELNVEEIYQGINFDSEMGF
jgi:Uma2 family endonuclease